MIPRRLLLLLLLWWRIHDVSVVTFWSLSVLDFHFMFSATDRAVLDLLTALCLYMEWMDPWWWCYTCMYVCDVDLVVLLVPVAIWLGRCLATVKIYWENPRIKSPIMTLTCSLLGAEVVAFVPLGSQLILEPRYENLCCYLWSDMDSVHVKRHGWCLSFECCYFYTVFCVLIGDSWTTKWRIHIHN